MADPVPNTVLRTYKFRLLPRKGEHQRLRLALDHTRDLYNSALEERIGAYRLKGETRNYVAQCKALTELRADPAYAEFAATMQRWPLKKLDIAFQAFFRRLKDGERAGFPRFRSLDRFNSFGFSDRNGWGISGARLYMKGIGRVRLHLHRPLLGAILSCQIKRDGKGWVALIACKVESAPLAATGRNIGIDLGITSFIATSHGETVAGFKIGRRSAAETKRRSRALARCRRGSAGRRKAKTRLMRHHEGIANSRRTFHHQLAARIVRDHDLIAIENLNVKGLAASALARDVNDAGWASFIDLLTEKAESAARVLVKVDCRFTSQTCPGCGLIKAKTLATRIHRCDCGCLLDRDVAAAKIILHRAVVGPGVDKQRATAVGPGNISPNLIHYLRQSEPGERQR